MQSNYDYLEFLNLSPPPSGRTESDSSVDDLDFWLNADLGFPAVDSLFADERKPVAEATIKPSPITAAPIPPSLDQTFAFSASLQPPLEFNFPALDQLQSLQSQAPQPQQQTASQLQFQQPAIALSAPPSLILNTLPLLPQTPVVEQTPVIAQTPVIPSQLLIPNSAFPVAVNPTPVTPSTPTVPQPSPSEDENHKVRDDEELDKRRRNTAASARFRAKKKLREQHLETTAKEMTEKSERLEKRVKEYEMEIKWLRQLLTDREPKKRIREIYEENGLNFVEGTFAAGNGPESAAFAPFPAGNVNVAAAAAVFASALAMAQQQQPGRDAKKPRLSGVPLIAPKLS